MMPNVSLAIPIALLMVLLILGALRQQNNEDQNGVRGRSDLLDSQDDGLMGDDESGMIGGKYGCTVPSLRAVYGPELRNDLQQSAASKQGGFVETARVFISIPCASSKSDMVNITQMAPRVFLSSQQGESIQRCEGPDPPLFTILMIDPDAPSRADPRFAEYLHWAVGNIPCPNFPEQKLPGIPLKSSDLDIASSQILMDYVGPSPPPGTGPHRYVLTLFQQPPGGPIDFDQLPPSRARFNMQAFAEKYGIKRFASVFYTISHCNWVAGMCVADEDFEG